MRMRIALVMVGLAFATIAIGQEPASPRVKLRTQVAKLRAEVELLQIEHDAEVDGLRLLVKEALELGREDRQEADAKAAGRKDEISRAEFDRMASLSKEAGQKVPVFEDYLKEIEQAKKDIASEKVNKAKELTRAKADFVEKTIAFNEKKLELVDLEQRLNASR